MYINVLDLQCENMLHSYTGRVNLSRFTTLVSYYCFSRTLQLNVHLFILWFWFRHVSPDIIKDVPGELKHFEDHDNCNSGEQTEGTSQCRDQTRSLK